MTKKSNGEGSIYHSMRNGKKYYTGQITVGIKPDGTPDRKSFSGFKKFEVLRKMELAKAQVGLIDYSKDKVRFGEMFIYWLFKVKAQTIKPRTLEKYESLVRLKIEPYRIARMPLLKINALVLQQHFNDLLKAKEISVAGAPDLLTLVKSYMEYLVLNDYIAKNYAYNVVLPKEEIKDEKPNVLDLDEQNLLARSLDLEVDIDLMIYVMLCTGLRRAEAMALQWSDFKNSTLDINKQLQEVAIFGKDRKRITNREFTSLKTKNSYRVLPLPKKVIVALQNHKLNQSRKRLLLGQEYKNQDFIFTDGFGNPVYKNGAGKRLDKLCKELGITRITPHGLRHTYCTRLFEAGIDVKTVQKLMGQGDISTTLNIYTHVMQHVQEEAVRKFESYSM